MGQTNSKKPKDGFKHTSIVSETIPVEAHHKSVFDHVIEQVIANSGTYRMFHLIPSNDFHLNLILSFTFYF